MQLTAPTVAVKVIVPNLRYCL